MQNSCIGRIHTNAEFIHLFTQKSIPKSKCNHPEFIQDPLRAINRARSDNCQQPRQPARADSPAPRRAARRRRRQRGGLGDVGRVRLAAREFLGWRIGGADFGRGHANGIALELLPPRRWQHIGFGDEIPVRRQRKLRATGQVAARSAVAAVASCPGGRCPGCGATGASDVQ